MSISAECQQYCKDADARMCYIDTYHLGYDECMWDDGECSCPDCHGKGEEDGAEIET